MLPRVVIPLEAQCKQAASPMMSHRFSRHFTYFLLAVSLMMFRLSSRPFT